MSRGLKYMFIKIIEQSIAHSELVEFAKDVFGDFVKAVVDLERGIMAIGGELHADEEALLLEQGSKQSNLWGINLHVDRKGEDFVEFDSMINIRPSQNNRSRGVEDPETRKLITAVVARLVGN